MIHVSNYSQLPFQGWLRTTTDQPFPASTEFPDGTKLVRGRAIGTDAHVVDVRIALAPFDVQSIDPAAAYLVPVTLPTLPQDPVSFFGVPTAGGVPFALLEASPDGAGIRSHLRARVGDFVVDWWQVYYPGQLWMTGEVVVTASNPGSPFVQFAAMESIGIDLPGALVAVAGVIGQPLVRHGEVFADGQARSLPVVVLLHPETAEPHQWSSFGAAMRVGGICARGLTKLLPHGNPVPSDTAPSPLVWTRRHIQDATARLMGWDAGPLGVVARSANAGNQEDAVFVGAECMAGPESLGAETVRYLVALGQSRRPCHHLELDGSLLDLSRHPQLRMWDGRPHWHRGVSPDQLGKSRGITEADASGWFGPDVEHWFLNTLAAAARLTGSPALQWQLGAQARVYLCQWTSAPGLSTSQPYSARAIGWEGIGVSHLWDTLEDRGIAMNVMNRWRDRAEGIVLPAITASGDRWDVRIDDPRLGSGAWWLPWQQSVGAYGLDLAGEVFGCPAARAAALRAAKLVVDEAWRCVDGQWLTVPQMAVDLRGEVSGQFNQFGMPLAVAVVLRHEPQHEQARAIWAQIGPKGGSWIAPGVPL